jgi:hypothetical protein
LPRFLRNVSPPSSGSISRFIRSVVTSRKIAIDIFLVVEIPDLTLVFHSRYELVPLVSTTEVKHNIYKMTFRPRNLNAALHVAVIICTLVVCTWGSKHLCDPFYLLRHHPDTPESQRSEYIKVKQGRLGWSHVLQPDLEERRDDTWRRCSVTVEMWL